MENKQEIKKYIIGWCKELPRDGDDITELLEYAGIDISTKQMMDVVKELVTSGKIVPLKLVNGHWKPNPDGKILKKTHLAHVELTNYWKKLRDATDSAGTGSMSDEEFAEFREHSIRAIE